ncbi:MAG TPA: hypothetical protein VKC57_10440 [Ktedonobacterales bacterium]|nr:hypothetical protein [Ktedonobacterales bacterium]
MQSPYEEFRRKLDAVLRRRDAAALRQFLIDEGQWQTESTSDPERAMWMMIATSPALSDLHAQAYGWLTKHGYDEEVRALRGDHAEPAARPPARKPHSKRTGLDARRRSPQQGTRESRERRAD